MSARVTLKPGKERPLERPHPRVFAAAVERVQGAPAAGDTVAVHAADGSFLAWAAWSPQSLIRLRLLSTDPQARVDEAFLQARVHAAVGRRRALAADTDALRLVFGEADGLPGLVVDRYGSLLVTQFHGNGVERARSALLDALTAATGCHDIYDRSDPATRAREGLAPLGGVLRGAAPTAPVAIVEHSLHYRVDVQRGHKTGFYIDQRDSRLALRQWTARLVAERAGPVRALNCFAYTGGFSLAMLAGGASAVLSIDSSADALALARSHVALNGFAPEHAEWLVDDVFAALRRLRDDGRQFDLIVLDPPRFASNQHQLERAARAYKDIALNGLKLLAPGGVLATFSCSSAMTVELFQKVVAGAVIDAGVDACLLARLGAGADHPVLMTHPEGEYLKGLLLRRV